MPSFRVNLKCLTQAPTRRQNINLKLKLSLSLKLDRLGIVQTSNGVLNTGILPL